MSMWLSLAKFETRQMADLKSNLPLLESIFRDGESVSLPGFDFKRDMFGTRYDDLFSMITAFHDGVPGPAFRIENGHTIYRTAKEIDFDIEESWVAKAAGNGMGQEIDIEFNYGPGFLLTPQQVKEASLGFAREAWLKEFATVDDDQNIPGLIKFYAEAAKQGRFIVGGVD
jgi:hypothetical protein